MSSVIEINKLLSSINNTIKEIEKILDENNFRKMQKYANELKKQGDDILILYKLNSKKGVVDGLKSLLDDKKYEFDIITEERNNLIKEFNTKEAINYKAKKVDEIKEKYLEAKSKNELLFLNIGNDRILIKEDYINNLSNIIENILYESNFTEISADGYETSDPESILLFKNPTMIKDYSFSTLPIQKRNNSNSGSYFGYVNTADKIDLSDLQIFTESQLTNIRNVNNCLVSSLKISGLTEDKLNKLTIMIRKHKHFDNLEISNDYVLKRDLSKIANVLEICINVCEIGNNFKKIYRKYGNKKFTIYNIVLFKDHYFPDIILPYTKYAIEHYEEIKHLENFNELIKNSNKLIRKPSRFISSVKIVEMLYKQDYFKKSLVLTKFQQNQTKKEKDDFYLTNIDKECHPIINKKINFTNINDNERFIYFADSECIVSEINDNEEYEHIPFLVGYVAHDNDTTKIYTNVNDFLKNIINDSLKKTKDKKNVVNNIVIYFHNLKYDYSVLFKDISKRSELIKSGMIYEAEINFNGYNIKLRDSYKHLSIKLDDFGRTYNLGDFCKKSAYMPYNLYNKNNINLPFISLEKLYEYGYNHDLHYEIIEPFLTIRGGKKMFKHMDFYRYYLKYDCLTLKHGFLKHREFMFQMTELDIFDFLTSSSVVDQFYKNQGVYDGVFEISGNLREFVMSAMIGGRVSTRINDTTTDPKNIKKITKIDDIHGKIADFDACSLYPSAMSVINGFPVGKPEIIKDFNNVFNSTENYYICQINITKINKKQQIPFISYKLDGKRLYDDDLSKHPNGLKIVVDKITLEDYIRFHEIEYTFIQGIYWTNFNNKINNIITKLYNKRNETKQLLKQTGDKKYDITQNIIKLLMNSSYGKTLMKESENKIVFIKKKDFNKFISKNYNHVIKFNEFKYQYRIVMKNKTIDHKNRSHCGVYVLSYSKRIMNQVMNTANNNQIPIYYQDTDSLHMQYDDVSHLAQCYKNDYNKDLIGSGLCQFHNDFDLNGNSNTWSTRSIILGKKCYLDILENDKNETGFHIRMKGVGSNVIKKNYNDILNVFEKLRDGYELEFDLTKGSLKFDTKMGCNVITKHSFIRKIKF